MNLLECLVALALSMLLLNPLLKTSADLLAKQIQYEKSQALISEAERAFELIGRAIRMAGYRNIKSSQKTRNHSSKTPDIEVQKKRAIEDLIPYSFGTSYQMELILIASVMFSIRSEPKINWHIKAFWWIDKRAFLKA